MWQIWVICCERMQTFEYNNYTWIKQESNIFPTFCHIQKIVRFGETNAKWTFLMDLKWTKWMYVAQFIMVKIGYIQPVCISHENRWLQFCFGNDEVINTPTSNFWFWIALIDLDAEHNESKKWFNLHIAYYYVWNVSNTFRAQLPQQFKMHGLPFASHSKVSYAVIK